MSSPHAALLFVLLLLPGTTLRDWQNAHAPHLQLLMSNGCLALMNARTGERNRITPVAGARTILAGARMRASASAAGLGYPADADNLPAALRAAGVSVAATGPLAATLSLPPPGAERRTTAGRFLLVDLGNDPAQADTAIGKWAELVNRQGGEMMIVSPNPSPTEYRSGDQLTPVLLSGPNVPSGTLTSPSTHQPGLVANTDIAPTIAGDFHARLPVPAFGSPVEAAAVSDADVPSALAAQDEIWQAQSHALDCLPYLAGLIALLVAAITFCALRKLPGTGMAVIIVSAMPLALLLCNRWLLFLSLAISATGGAFALRRNPWLAVAWIAVATLVLVTSDALFAAGSLTAGSLLGYSPLEGARYYGIGNEAMGALLGAAVVVTGLLAQSARIRLAPAAIWLVLAFALGWPDAGAKAGGFFVALIALAAYLWGLSGRSLASPLVWGLLACAIVLMGGLLALAGTLVGHTHIGQAVQLARLQGFAAIGSLAARKAGMELHLAFHSVWAIVLVVAAVGARLLYPARDLRDAKVTIQTGIAAAAASVALNDAGVVAAALCSLSLWAYCAVVPIRGCQDERLAQRIASDPPVATG